MFLSTEFYPIAAFIMPDSNLIRIENIFLQQKQYGELGFSKKHIISVFHRSYIGSF